MMFAKWKAIEKVMEILKSNTTFSDIKKAE
jgi:hypothetical protein